MTGILSPMNDFARFSAHSYQSAKEFVFYFTNGQPSLYNLRLASARAITYNIYNNVYVFFVAVKLLSWVVRHSTVETKQRFYENFLGFKK